MWGVASLVFCLFSILPGDPSRMMLGQRDNEEMRLAIQKKYGFDKPVTSQYLYFMNDLSPLSLHGNSPSDFTNLSNHPYSVISSLKISSYRLVLKTPYLRESFVRKGVSVSSIIGNTLPNTFVLAITAMCIALFLGISLGLFSATNQHKSINSVIVGGILCKIYTIKVLDIGAAEALGCHETPAARGL